MRRFLKPMVLAAALSIVPFTAFADDFPSRPVKIVVPQTPGGASDALARILGQKLSEKWKQPVVVDNRAGAGGNVGMEAVAAAQPDGYTLLMSYVGTQAINGALYKKLPFDPGSDFAPVATIATLPFVMVARTDAPFKTVAQLVAAAKARSITYGSAGNGSVNHLVGEMLNAAAGIKLVHVPYRGAAPALQDLMGGQIDLVFTSLPSVAGAIRGGTLNPIAVTSAKRAASFNTIPTIAEAGYKDFDVNPWFGLMAPKRTPPEIISRINRDINELLRSKEVIDSLAAQGAEPYATRPEEFGAVLKADLVKWGNVVKASGASVD
ncbi:tripartite tricarboxylate transporter substrate binding protein [soil metagenome]